VNCESIFVDYRPLVKVLVGQFKRTLAAVDWDDLFSEANGALWKAYLTYRPQAGMTFGQYARMLIRQRLCVIYAHERRRARLGDPIVENSDGDRIVDEIPTYDADHVEADELARVMHEAMSCLPIKERLVLRMRFYGEGMTLELVGEELGFTRERVRQIEESALAKLRRKVDW